MVRKRLVGGECAEKRKQEGERERERSFGLGLETRGRECVQWFGGRKGFFVFFQALI